MNTTNDRTSELIEKIKALAGEYADRNHGTIFGKLDSITWCQFTAALDELARLAALHKEGEPPVEFVGKWEGAEYWMPLAWALCADECGEEACTELVWEGGTVPEPWGDRWLKYEDEAKRLIALVRANTSALQASSVVPAEPDWRDEVQHLSMMASTAMHQDSRDQRNILEDIAERLCALHARGSVLPDSKGDEHAKP